MANTSEETCILYISDDKTRSTWEVRIDVLTACETHRIWNLETCVRESNSFHKDTQI